MTIDLFKKLFVHRSDIFGQQNPSGAYALQKYPLTDDIISNHFAGRVTIGLYQIAPIANTVKWACIDIDINKKVWGADDFKIEDWDKKLQEQASDLQNLFTSKGIKTYLEFSGFKGYHIWMFFDPPVSAKDIRLFLSNTLKNVSPLYPEFGWEIFPKQDSIDEPGGVGSCVKAPNGYHHKSGQFSKFITPLDAATEFINIELISNRESSLWEIINKCVALRSTWEKCLDEKTAPNYIREALAYLFVKIDGGKDFLKREFLSKLDNFNEQTTDYHLDRMEQRYKPITCITLQSDKYQYICPVKCQEIGMARSPIAFYHRAVGVDPDNIEQASSKFDSIYQEKDCYYQKFYKGDKLEIRQMSSFVINIRKRIIIKNEAGQKVLLEGMIRKDGIEYPFSIDSNDYPDNKKLESAIYQVIGIDGVIMDPKDLVRNAINKYAISEDEFILKQFGYNLSDDPEETPIKFYAPSVVVDKYGVRPNEEIKVDLQGEGIAANLDLAIISDSEFDEVKELINDTLVPMTDFTVAHSALAITFMPIIFPFLKGDKTRFTLWLRGGSGTGKSYFAQLLQNFYGTFNTVTTWYSTPNALAKIGFHMKDALYVVDDYKSAIFTNFNSKSQYLTILQNYADNTARARMTLKNYGIAETWPIRGWLLATGEDTPETETSNIARMIPLTVRNRLKDLNKGRKALLKAPLFPGFTARYIHHIFNTNPLLINREYEKNMDIYYQIIQGSANDMRISRNFALLTTSHKFISEFIWTKNAAEKIQDKFVILLKDLIPKIVVETTEELSSQRFIEIIKDLLSTGRARIQMTKDYDSDSTSKIPIIGFMEDNLDELTGDRIQTTNLITNIAFTLANQFLKQSNKSLGHSQKAIVSELHEHDYTLDPLEKSIRFNKRAVKVIRIKPGHITC